MELILNCYNMIYTWPWHRESIKRQIGKLNQMNIMELDIGNDDGTLEYMRCALSSPNADTCLRSLTPCADLALCFADRQSNHTTSSGLSVSATTGTFNPRTGL